MPELRIRLFGHLELARDSFRLSALPTHKAEALFAMLALQPGHLFVRQQLMDTLWQNLDEVRAARCLNTELWRVRSALKAGGLQPGRYIVARREGVGFNNDASFWLDVKIFQEAIGVVTAVSAAQIGTKEKVALERAIELYRGDLLEGMYDDWCLLHREYLRSRYLQALEMLMRWHLGHQDWGAAIDCGQKLLAQDLLLEHVHRALMRCHANLGNRSAAIRQYQRLAELLRRELGVQPMEESVRLSEAICSGRVDFQQPIEQQKLGDKATTSPIVLAIERLRHAHQCLGEAIELLADAAPDRKHGAPR
jgi:DNA-binding SARP family transcriptional activator